MKLNIDISSVDFDGEMWDAIDEIKDLVMADINLSNDRELDGDCGHYENVKWRSCMYQVDDSFGSELILDISLNYSSRSWVNIMLLRDVDNMDEGVLDDMVECVFNETIYI